MARTKQLNIVCSYNDGVHFINDLGFGKSPRFELYNSAEKKVLKKSDNPYDFDDYMRKHVWSKEG